MKYIALIRPRSPAHAEAHEWYGLPVSVGVIDHRHTRPAIGNCPHERAELFYEVHGDSPPLVLVMGIGYDSSLSTLRQVPVLSTRFRVVLLDNRDAGRSSRADHPYTIGDIADDAAGLLDALDIQRTHLLGLSMGSMIGMEWRGGGCPAWHSTVPRPCTR